MWGKADIPDGYDEWAGSIYVIKYYLSNKISINQGGDDTDFYDYRTALAEENHEKLKTEYPESRRQRKGKVASGESEGQTRAQSLRSVYRARLRQGKRRFPCIRKGRRVSLVHKVERERTEVAPGIYQKQNRKQILLDQDSKIPSRSSRIIVISGRNPIFIFKTPSPFTVLTLAAG